MPTPSRRAPHVGRLPPPFPSLRRAFDASGLTPPRHPIRQTVADRGRKNRLLRVRPYTTRRPGRTAAFRRNGGPSPRGDPVNRTCVLRMPVRRRVPAIQGVRVYGRHGVGAAWPRNGPFPPRCAWRQPTGTTQGTHEQPLSPGLLPVNPAFDDFEARFLALRLDLQVLDDLSQGPAFGMKLAGAFDPAIVLVLLAGVRGM